MILKRLPRNNWNLTLVGLRSSILRIITRHFCGRAVLIRVFNNPYGRERRDAGGRPAAPL